MASNLKLYDLGKDGVNVDSDPVNLLDTELRKAQNTIRDPLGAIHGLRKRPGLAAFNESLTGGEILGGIGVPLLDQSTGGSLMMFIGRGPTS